MKEDLKKEVETYTKEILDFINLEPRLGQTKAFPNEIFNIYLRNTFKYINNKKVSTIQIANINVQPEYQNQGVGSYLINTIHENNKNEMTYIEIVHNTILRNWLEKNEWALAQSVPLEYSYYKLKEN